MKRRFFQDADAKECRIRWTMQVWIWASGNTAVIASGKPFNPSTMAISMSATPPLSSSFIPPSQNFGSLGLLDRQAEDLLGAVRPDAQGEIDRLVAHRPF